MRLFRLTARSTLPLTLQVSLSALLLSGCSWVDQMGWPSSSGAQASNPYAMGQGGTYSGRQGQNSAYGDPCQIPHAQAPIPYGCSPSQVSIGTVSGGFSQKPQFGAQYASGSYGTHAGGNNYAPGSTQGVSPQLRKPRFRASLDLGLEKSASGDLLDYQVAPFNPITGYDPYDYVEGRASGTPADGAVVRTTWFADSRLAANPNPYDEVKQPNLSFGDAWSTPTTVGVGGEFIVSDRATIFARAGYSYAEGDELDTIEVEGTIYQQTDVDSYDENGVYTGTTTSTDYIPEQLMTRYSFDFTDMERIDLEAGGRFYMDPIAGKRSGRTVTPFVGASAGASRHNAVSYTIDQRQLFYTSVYEDDRVAEYYDLDVLGYDVDNNPATPVTNVVNLYDSQWVASGRLNAGVEWQVTPKTALAFETGIRIDGARDYANGTKGDTNVSVPFTLRGSFNF